MGAEVARASLVTDWAHAAAYRTRRHSLDRRVAAKEFLAVSTRLCGLHAQVMSSAELTLWNRVSKLDPAAVSNALWRDRTLVKSWLMRGTLHLTTVEDFHLFRSALSSYRHYLRPGWLRSFGVSEEEIVQLTEAIAVSLNGSILTRSQLADKVARVSGSANLGEQVTQSWGSLLKPANYLGHVCFAPGNGQSVCFTSPHSWLGPADPPQSEAALNEVTRRFFHVNGPATRNDLARWLGIQRGNAGQRIAALGEEIVPVDVAGCASYILQCDLKALQGAKAVNSVRLLPAFDQYVIAASAHAENLLPPQVSPKVIYRAQGWVSPVLLVNGRFEGIWTYRRRGRMLDVWMYPFARVSKEVKRAAEEEAESLAEYFDATPAIEWRPVSTSPKLYGE